MDADLIRRVAERLGWGFDDGGNDGLACAWSLDPDQRKYLHPTIYRGRFTPAGTVAMLEWLLERGWMVYRETDVYVAEQPRVPAATRLEADDLNTCLARAVIAMEGEG